MATTKRTRTSPQRNKAAEDLTHTQRAQLVDAFSAYLQEHPDAVSRIAENVNSTYIASSPTQEDWYWGRLATGGEEDYYWRRLSDNWYQKDVIPNTYLEIHNSCYEAYNANPLAFAIIEITVSFVLGKGVKVVAQHKRVQEVIDRFWNDPDNRMQSRIYDMCRELALYGEIFIRFFVNKFDGSMKVRFIDPSIIDQVDTDPDDIEHHLRYHRRPIGPSPTQTLDASANTLDSAAIRGLDNPGDPTMQGKWFDAGTAHDQVTQFAINKVSNAKRGKSDLATLLPWLRRYKDWLTDRVRINKYKGAFLWDVSLKGADQKTIARKKMDYAYPPEPGTVIIHNESEAWTAVQPQINANDAKEDGRAIKLMVAIGATLPEHYLSDGDNNTRATAEQMGLPTFLKFQLRQETMKLVLSTILDAVIREAQNAGQLPVYNGKGRKVKTDYDIIFPEFTREDDQEVGTGINWLMTGLNVAKQNSWISDDTAMTALHQFLNVEVDLHVEKEKIEADRVKAQGQMQQLAQMAAQAQQTQPTQQPAQQQEQEQADG